MDRAREVGLFRHGATSWNTEGRLQGLTDTELSESGRLQVERAASHLKHHGWDMILSSPLIRARDSAAILASVLNLPEPLVSDVITERSFGIGEGMNYPQWFELQASGKPIEGAETDIEVDVRVERFLALASELRGSRILVVSHGGFIRRVLRKVTNDLIPPAESRLENASLQRLVQGDTSWSLSEWNPVSREVVAR